jgi:hypothetical protein
VNNSPHPSSPPVLSTMFSSVLSMSSISVEDIVIEEEPMDGKNLVITCSLSHSDLEIQTCTLIGCGATGYAFVPEYFAGHH